jgi:hypothetical protein
MKWKVGVVVVVVLIATGVTLGLGGCGGGGATTQGTYVLKTESGNTSTLVLKPNGAASLELQALKTKMPVAYVVEGNRVKVWDKSLSSPKDSDFMWYTIKDGNLVDDEGETWTKQ